MGKSRKPKKAAHSEGPASQPPTSGIGTKKIVLYIPLTYNDRSKVPKEVLLDIKEEIFVAWGGHTDEGTVTGTYRMQPTSKKRIEKHTKLAVVLPENDIPALEMMAGKWANRLEQEAIYMEITDAVVKFIPPLSEEE